MTPPAAVPNGAVTPGPRPPSAAPREGFRASLGAVIAVVPRRRHLVGLALASLVSGLLEAGTLLLLARAAVGITAGGDELVLGPVELGTSTALGVAALLLAVKLLVSVLAAALSARLAAAALVGARRRVLEAFHASSWRVQSAMPTGQLQDLLTVHVDRAADAVLVLSGLLVAILGLLVLVGSSIVVSPIGAAGVLVAGIGLTLAMRPLSTKNRALVQQQARAGQQFASAVSEAAAVARDARVAGVDLQLVERTMARSEAQVEPFRRSRFLGLLVGPIYQSIALLIIIAGVLMVSVLGDGGSNEVEALGAVVLLLIRAMSYGQLGQQGVHQIQEKAAYLREIDRTFDELRAEAISTRGDRVPDGGGLTLEGVRFGYGDGEDVLHQVSAVIAEGESVGLVGPSGSGKTTLMRLLLRLIEPTDGQISYGERPLDELSLAEWYATVAFVPQDPRLLTATVAENIALFRPSSAAHIEQAARAAHLHDEILELPAGYDTVVGPAGLSLSGGQAQRLTMARALIGEPRLLLLDEPTSALDMRSEARIQETLAAVRGRITTVIIAHRLSTLVACDRIIVLVNGRIEAVGTHHALLEQSAFYADAVALTTPSSPTSPATSRQAST